eukprot:TRINITY_DN8304_c0_g1_i1.p1 TRINITY_DN8304_c0_g1~~TRINITY_DN8304_c0_g1_i1.p1  ORF type:complete len:365 (-),score=27.55 TRINITY_DN8304_c0_g1_i1:268-1362(-)
MMRPEDIGQKYRRSGGRIERALDRDEWPVEEGEAPFVWTDVRSFMTRDYVRRIVAAEGDARTMCGELSANCMTPRLLITTLLGHRISMNFGTLALGQPKPKLATQETAPLHFETQALVDRFLVYQLEESVNFSEVRVTGATASFQVRMGATERTVTVRWAAPPDDVNGCFLSEEGILELTGYIAKEPVKPAAIDVDDFKPVESLSKRPASAQSSSIPETEGYVNLLGIASALSEEGSPVSALANQLNQLANTYRGINDDAQFPLLVRNLAHTDLFEEIWSMLGINARAVFDVAHGYRQLLKLLGGPTVNEVELGVALRRIEDHIIRLNLREEICLLLQGHMNVSDDMLRVWDPEDRFNFLRNTK